MSQISSKNIRGKPMYNLFKPVVATVIAIVAVLIMGSGANAIFSLSATLVVPDADTQVRLDWTAFPNAMYYDIYRSGTKIKTVNINTDRVYTSYTDTGLKPETRYDYTIKALNAGSAEMGTAASSVTTSQMRDPSVPSAAFNINDRTITITWTNNSLATSSTEIRRWGSSVVAAVYDTGTSCTFVDPGIFDNTAVQYLIVSKDNSNHYSPGSVFIPVIPVSPPVIAASIQNGVVTVTWNVNTFIEKYALERSKYNMNVWGGWEEINTSIPAGSYYAIDNTITGGTYRYRLNMKSSTGYTGSSNVSESVTRPVAPSGLSCVMTASNRIDLSWTNNDDNVSNLRVERRTDWSGYIPIANLDRGVTTYTDLSAFSPGSTYYYRIVAYESAADFTVSNEYSIFYGIPAAPSILNLTVVSGTQLDLNWTDNSTNELGFKVEKRVDSGNYTEVATIPANTTVYSDTGLSPGHVYTYRVRSYSVAGYSPVYSNEVQSSTTIAVVPNMLLATPVSTSVIDLSWSYAGSGYNYYTVIERRTGVSGTWTAIQPNLAGSVTKYSDTGLQANTQYYYRIKTSIGSNIYSPLFPGSTGRSAYTLLYTPTGLSAGLNAYNAGQVDLSWTNNSGETAFSIERKKGNEDFSTAAITDIKATSWSDTDLEPYTVYTYRIKAITSVNTSDYSNTVSVGSSYLNTPANLAAAAVSGSDIRLAWSYVSSSETGFEVWRKTGASGQFVKIADLRRGTNGYTDTGLLHDTVYTYTVRAYISGNNAYSGFSNEATAKIVPVSPAGDLQYKVVTVFQIILKWKDNSNNESGFKVERKTGKDGTWSEIGGQKSGGTSFTSTGLVPYTRYYYRIKAYNDTYNSSSYSEEIEVITGIPKPPTGLRIRELSAARMELTWYDNSDNESGFKIERRKLNEKFKEIARVGAGVTSYTDRSVIAGVRYYYRISAFNASGYADSSEVSAGTKVPVPAGNIKGLEKVRNMVEDLVSRGVISSKAAVSFNPDETITRGEFVSFMVKAFKIEKIAVGVFADVNHTHRYYKEILTARIAGIVSGDSNNRFNPERGISREEAAVIAARALNTVGKPLPAYDVSILDKYVDRKQVSGYALSSLASMFGEKLMEVKSGRKILPGGPVTRAEAVSLIYSIIDR